LKDQKIKPGPPPWLYFVLGFNSSSSLRSWFQAELVVGERVYPDEMPRKPFSVSPPDHRAVRRTADDGAVTFNTIGRLDTHGPDATRVDGKVVVERRIGKVAMHPAEISEIRATAGQRIVASVSRCRSGEADQRSNNCSGNDLGDMRHFLILAVSLSDDGVQ
jgi:hypothetical protein